MPTVVYDAMGAAPGDGMIYFAGGSAPGGSNPVSTMQQYNPTTNSWASKASMPTARWAGSAAVIGGIIYVAGGWGAHLPYNVLEAYNPATNTWTSLAGMSHLSGCGVAGNINNKLYVFTPCNGYSVSPNPSLLDVYDPVANSWTSLPSGPNSHVSGAGGVINGKLYIVGGGGNTGTIISTLDVYDPASGWSPWLPCLLLSVIWVAPSSTESCMWPEAGTVTTYNSTTYAYNPTTNT